MHSFLSFYLFLSLLLCVCAYLCWPKLKVNKQHLKLALWLHLLTPTLASDSVQQSKRQQGAGERSEEGCREMSKCHLIEMGYLTHMRCEHPLLTLLPRTVLLVFVCGQPVAVLCRPPSLSRAPACLSTELCLRFVNVSA